MQAQDLALADAIYDFTTASGFLAVASTDLTGTVTLQADKMPINDVLDKIALAANAKWQPVYLLALPRVLSDAEVEARTEQRFQNQWSQFWAKSPADRATDIQNRVDGINRMAEMMKQNPQMASRMQTRGGRMMSRMERYSASLSMDQRRELLPLVRAMGAAVNNR
jgi:hypothetical protein